MCGFPFFFFISLGDRFGHLLSFNVVMDGLFFPFFFFPFDMLKRGVVMLT